MSDGESQLQAVTSESCVQGQNAAERRDRIHLHLGGWLLLPPGP